MIVDARERAHEVQPVEVRNRFERASVIDIHVVEDLQMIKAMGMPEKTLWNVMAGGAMRYYNMQ